MEDVTTGICVCESTRFEFNLNGIIRFNPTEYGLVIYRAYWMPYCKDGKGRELEVDDQGFAEMQLWAFMEIFGPKMEGGMHIPVETSVIFINKTQEQLNMCKRANKSGQ
ncbi:hypothetical protein LCGC14_3143680 [marine sediment metagenome]|uniref:Uncharacterized protein n=1 Tax=marine sediment metagenome TaxID=412755 RepID=A0A0F8VW31_9ZZZZ|nr:hypothetical protein [Phycisphaerales bacterium]